MFNNAQFWQNWNSINPTEAFYIKALEYSLNYTLAQSWRSHIIAIYVYGSFQRRDITPKSDIDVKIIVDDAIDLNILADFRKISKTEIARIMGVENHPVNLGYYSLSELRTGKFGENKAGRHLPPTDFVADMIHIQPVCGQRISEKELYVLSNKKRVERQLYFVELSCRPGSKIRERTDTGIKYCAKFMLNLVYLLDLEKVDTYYPFIKKDMYAKYAHDKNHIVQLIQDIITNTEKYIVNTKQSKILQDSAFTQFNDFIAEVKQLRQLK